MTYTYRRKLAFGGSCISPEGVGRYSASNRGRVRTWSELCNMLLVLLGHERHFPGLPRAMPALFELEERRFDMYL